MNLLLLLSALLSAIGGMGQAVRGGGGAQAVCSVAAPAVLAPTRRTIVAARPTEPLPGIVTMLSSPGEALVLSPATPIYAARRRE